MPDGHAEVIRELVVPTLRGDRVVSILGVGNKPSDYDEKDVELIAYVADITWTIVERKRAEVQLQEYHSSLEVQNMELRKFSLAIEQSGSTVVITDKEGTIQYANPHFEETTGYTAREALGQNPRILKSGEQDAAFYQALWATISGGQIWYGEFHNRRKDGTLYWEQATIAPVHNNAGQIVNYIGIKDDITERKRAEESLRQSNTELQTRNEELDTFGHTVAHDLKNPLNNIIGFAYLMEDRENPPSAEEIYQMARTIKQMGLKMDSIIEELMLLAGLHKAEVKMEPLNMANIVAEIVERLGPQIQDSQARLTCPTDWPQAMGYAPWVGEVWVNYFSNAIKYGGHPPHIELGASQEGDVVRFWIHDNGPGLSPEEQARLFTPFERLKQAGLSGHGLGLSIVRRIVERMGGQVSVKSTGVAGEGSTFSFTLPAA
jgi:PAS domain S-box-containing protein